MLEKGGRLVFVINVIGVVMIVMVFGVLVPRLFVHFQLTKVEKDPQHSQEFRRKLRIVQQLASQKNTVFLLVISWLLATALLLLMISYFRMEDQLAKTQQRVVQVEEVVQRVKNEQKMLISKVPLRSYPEEGLGLESMAWEKVFDENQQESLQPKIETELSQKLAPYFGLAQAIVSIDVPSQTLSLSLTGNTENEDNQKMIKANVNTFINEAKTIPRLTQIHIEVLVTAEEKDKTVYNETFLRKKDDQKFSKIENTSSDQKGKG